MAISAALKLSALSLLPRGVRRSVMVSRYEAEIAETGEVELLELRRFLKPGDLAVDVGSNLGTFTYEMSRLTGNVAAFEPNPALYKLVRNLALPGVTSYNMVLSSTDGMATLVIPRVHSGHVLASVRREVAVRNGGSDVDEISVKSARLDSMGLDRVAFIKIDVEGFEDDVLAGAMETIARDRPMLLIEIEERHNPGGLARISDLFGKMAYRTFFFYEQAWHSLAEFNAATHQSSAMLGGIERRNVKYVNNFLFVPDERAMDS